jgi:hypothetical protein
MSDSNSVDVFTTLATSGNTDFLGVENRQQGLCNNTASTTIDETIRVPLGYISNVSISDTKDYPTQSYEFDSIDMCMSDFRTLFFRPVTNHFHMSRQNYSHVAYSIPRQTYCDTSGSKKFSFVDSIHTNWASTNNINANSLPTVQNIQLIKAGHKFVSLVALKGCVSGLTFDEMIHEWIEFNPQSNTLHAVVECYIQYDPLEVSVKCIFNYKVTIPGSSYGQDDTKCPANKISAYLKNGMKIENNGCDCPGTSGVVTSPNDKLNGASNGSVSFAPNVDKDDSSVLTEKSQDDFYFGSKVVDQINDVNNAVANEYW